MQRKVVIDTCIYIEIFNRDKHSDQINWLNNISYLAYPVLHELLNGSESRFETHSLLEWGKTFSRLNRLIIPTPTTSFHIGQTYNKLRNKGKLDAINTRHHNDITIALLARQIGAIVLTRNKKDYKAIQSLVDFTCEFL